MNAKELKIKLIHFSKDSNGQSKRDKLRDAEKKSEMKKANKHLTT